MKFKNKKTGEVVDFSPCLINSALLSAQNRQRYYWANWEFTQPEDRGIVLADIIECDLVDRDDVVIMQRARGYNAGGIKAKDGKTPTLSANAWEHNNHLVVNSHYRKLTPRECFRLQTVPEHYIDKILDCGVSNSTLYKIAGNGWTDEVIAHILRCAKF